MKPFKVRRILKQLCRGVRVGIGRRPHARSAGWSRGGAGAAGALDIEENNSAMGAREMSCPGRCLTLVCQQLDTRCERTIRNSLTVRADVDAIESCKYPCAPIERLAMGDLRFEVLAALRESENEKLLDPWGLHADTCPGHRAFRATFVVGRSSRCRHDPGSDEFGSGPCGRAGHGVNGRCDASGQRRSYGAGRNKRKSPVRPRSAKA